MQTFAFKKEIKLNDQVGAALGSKTAHSSLSEVMKINKDHIQLEYITEFEGADLKEISRSMRKFNPDFSDAPEH